MHQFKPKMTGGISQDSMPLSPETHKEWSDKGGKHVINKGLSEGPLELTGRENKTLTKNEHSEKRGMKNKDPKPESKENAFYRGKSNSGGGYDKPTGVNKTPDKQAQGKSSKRGP